MRILLFSIGILFSQYSFAQNYQLTYGNEPFAPLSSPNTPVDWPFDWDDETSVVPFGFSFPVGDLTYDSLFLSSNGWAVSTDAQYEFNAYYVDLIAAGDETSVAYKTENVDGENVLKIEFLNAGFYEDTTGTARTSFQFWFYESGCWESRIGPSTIVDTFMIFEQYPGPFIGYANYSSESVLALIGTSSGPEILALDSIAFPSLSDVPADGLYYSFCNESSSSVKSLSNISEVLIYPNPASDYIVLQSRLAGAWRLMDLAGREIKSGRKTEISEFIDLSFLSKGIYLLNFSGQESLKLVIN
jgi:hypothetical protein